jgi:phosphoglycolate phosphatase-like HAD superfamily hydrolase
MLIRAVFFDLDETLIDDDRRWRIAVAATCNEIAARHPGIDAKSLTETYLTSSERLWRQFVSAPRTPGGLISTHDLRIAVWSSVLEAFHPDTLRLTDEIMEVYGQQRRENYACFGEVARRPERQRLSTLTS